jgi:peptide chain release factor 1
MDDATLAKFKENPRTRYYAEAYDRLLAGEKETREMLDDPAVAALAEDELKGIEAQKAELAAEMTRLAEAERAEEESPNEMVLEIRAGAGGDEAGLFARELMDMYERYAQAKGWSFGPVDASETDAGGYREASAEIRGQGCYEALRYETGVHRVQRVPATERQGRIHTSTATVAALPIRKKSKIEIKPDELLVEFSRSGGAGGQNVNKVETAVRIVHKPSGIDVRSTAERSQARNREKAMAILTAKLEQLEEAKAHAAEAGDRKAQVGTGDRSEKIRTYNFPQDRLTDHRIKKSWYGLEGIMAGKIGNVLEAIASGEVGEAADED